MSSLIATKHDIKCRNRLKDINDMVVFEEKELDGEHYSNKMKKLAVEVVNSFVDDLLPIYKINRYNIVSKDHKYSYQVRTKAQNYLDRHYEAVNWFISGEALKSIWFDILGFSEISNDLLTDLVHRKIENE